MRGGIEMRLNRLVTADPVERIVRSLRHGSNGKPCQKG